VSKARTLLYVLQQPGGLIKVGITANLPKRIRDLECMCGSGLEVLATCDILDLESHLHRMLDKHRLMGEWFSPDALPTLRQALPVSTKSKNITQCVECGRWFGRKRGRGGDLCASELCNKKHLQRIAHLGGSAMHEKAKGKTPYKSNCVICDTAVLSWNRPRTICDSTDCRQEHGLRMSARTPHRRNPTRTCTVNGCDRMARHANGICPTHYARLKVHGDVLAHVPVRPYRGLASKVA
jgi:hypothetical protein